MLRTYAIIDHESAVRDRIAHDRYTNMERFVSGESATGRRGKEEREDPLLSPRWVFQEIVTASVMICTEHEDGNIELVRFTTLSAPHHDERAIISELFSVLAETPHGTELVSWGGVWHDVPLLIVRAMRHGLTLPKDWEWMAWGGEGRLKHIDLLRLTTGGAKVKPVHLAELAAVLDLPAKMTEPAWAAARLIAAGDFEAVAEMCESDVITTACLLSHRRQLIGGRGSLAVALDRILRRVEELRPGRSYLPAIAAKRAALVAEQDAWFIEQVRAETAKLEITGLPKAA